MFEIGDRVICINASMQTHTVEELRRDMPNWVKEGSIYTIRAFLDNNGIVTSVLLEEISNPLKWFHLINRYQEPAFATWRFAKQQENLVEGSCKYTQGGSVVSRIIKRGDFVINDEPLAVFLLNCVTDALKVVGRMDRASNKLFISSFISLVNNTPNYVHSNFMTNLKANKDKFRLATLDPEEYKKLLKSIL